MKPEWNCPALSSECAIRRKCTNKCGLKLTTQPHEPPEPELPMCPRHPKLLLAECLICTHGWP